jgi:hypothetical protein
VRAEAGISLRSGYEVSSERFEAKLLGFGVKSGADGVFEVSTPILRAECVLS